MANPLAIATKALWAGEANFAGRLCRYRRDAEAFELTAIPSNPQVAEYQTEDISGTANELDFLTLAGDLALAGNIIEPQTGDLVELLGQDGQPSQWYAVTNRDGLRPFRYSDTSHTVTRIYTVETRPPTDEP